MDLLDDPVTHETVLSQLILWTLQQTQTIHIQPVLKTSSAYRCAAQCLEP